MTCPVCGGTNHVIGVKSDCESIHRKRRCDDCGYVFYTEEYESSSERYDELMREYDERRRVNAKNR